MRTADSWFEEYGESHRDPVNKRIHWICVPAIVWSVVALLWALPSPLAGFNWAYVGVAGAMLFYVFLSPRLALGLLLFLLACLMLSAFLDTHVPVSLWALALIVFVVAWIGQFIGHRIEGRKPSFFKDIAFLLIGPTWLMGFVYRRMGWGY